MGLGNLRASVIAYIFKRASMRPRRMGLGNIGTIVGVPADADASMRPRRMGLGNIDTTLVDGADVSSFNEAEAHGPRKSAMKL